MARKRRRYDDKFRANALVLLEASGYPDQTGGLTRTAKSLGMPESTLRAWWNGSRNPVSAELRGEKKKELTDLLRNEIEHAFHSMRNVRGDASYRDLTTAIAIMIDKLQLLSGKPTWIGEIQGLLQEGKVTPEQVEEELGHDLAAELFESIGLPGHTRRETQAASATTRE